MRLPSQSVLSFAGGAVISAALVFFVVYDYLQARPLADGSLRAVAFSLSSLIESTSSGDPSFGFLSGLQEKDVAYITVFDTYGTRIFHTNPELVGTRLDPAPYRDVFGSGRYVEERVRLATGEEAYELTTPLHVSGGVRALSLVLHTYSADAVIRRARAVMTTVFTLLAAGWVMAFLLHRYSVKAREHEREMARRKHLAEIGTLGAVMAHEVRNPLGGIKGYAQLLEEKCTDERQRKFAKYITAETVRLERLVETLLGYAREGPAELSRQPLGDIAVRSLSMVSEEAASSGIEVVTDIPAGVTVIGEKNSLEQVFLNLFKNAVQSMPDGGRLTVRARENGSTVDVAVEDTGKGIKEEDMGRVFDPFFTTKASGSGLGLAVCRKFVEEMGGSISVSSPPGGGSIFRVVLKGAVNRKAGPA